MSTKKEGAPEPPFGQPPAQPQSATMPAQATPPANGNGGAKTEEPKKPMEILKDYFNKWRPTLAQVLPKGVSLDRIIRIASNVYMNRPELHSCSPESMVRATVQCAELGLEPGPLLGEVAFVPYEMTRRRKDGNVWKEYKVLEVQCQPQYLGLIKLAKQAGGISDVYAVCVYTSEKTPTFDETGRLVAGFYQEQGTVRRIQHIPQVDDRSNDLYVVYGVVKFSDNTSHFEVLSKADIERFRSYSKAPGGPAWTNHYEAMAKKTAIRQTLKMVPKSPEKPLAKALAIDTAIDSGEAFSNELMASIEAEGVEVPQLPSPTQTAAQAMGIAQPTSRTADLAARLDQTPTPVQQAVLHDQKTGETVG
jgi:recombination protein RecT